MNISEAVVRSYRGGKNVKKTVGDKKSDREKRTGDPVKHENTDGAPRNNDRDSDTIQRSVESENTRGEGITFIGGKKDMNKTEGSGAKEEDEYQCFNCDYTQGTPFTKCPKCGAENTFEDL